MLLCDLRSLLQSSYFLFHLFFLFHFFTEKRKPQKQRQKGSIYTYLFLTSNVWKPINKICNSILNIRYFCEYFFFHFFSSYHHDMNITFTANKSLAVSFWKISLFFRSVSHNVIFKCFLSFSGKFACRKKIKWPK